MAAEPDRDDEPDDPRDVIDAGERRVIGPAVGLFAVAIVSLGMVAVLGFYVGLMAGIFDAQQQMAAQQIDANPTMPAAQKAQAKQSIGQVFRGMGVAFVVYVVTSVVACGVIGLGAYRVLTLTGRGWGVAAAVVAMVPCFTGYAWVVGLPVGIWALVVLCQPDVRAAFAAARRERKLALGADPD